MSTLFWITGRPHNGKTTLLRAMQNWRPELAAFDADVVRESLYPGLGYTAADRLCNIKILTNMAGMAVRYGGDAVVAAVSPFREHRNYARKRIAELGGRFVLIHVYGLSRELWKDTEYEEPQDANLHIDMKITSPQAAADKVISRYLLQPSRQLFIGRWQPFHKGHYSIVMDALQKGPVAIGVRQTIISMDDPIPALERVDAIRKTFEDEDVEVFVCPDINSIHIGRNVGYGIVKHQEVKGVSGTEERRKQRGD